MKIGFVFVLCFFEFTFLRTGSSAVTGMQASSVHALRCALGLSLPTDPIKVIEPYQMLGEIGTDLQNTLGVDVVPLGAPRTMFGFKTEGYLLVILRLRSDLTQMETMDFS